MSICPAVARSLGRAIKRAPVQPVLHVHLAPRAAPRGCRCLTNHLQTIEKTKTVRNHYGFDSADSFDSFDQPFRNLGVGREAVA